MTDEVSFLDKATFPLWYFSVTKSTKSHQRERSPLFENSSRVHELFARAMRGECVRQRDNAKVGGSATLCNLMLPRVRTYHTKKPSRFVHALSARPLKNGRRGRGFGLFVDGIGVISAILSIGYTWVISCRGRRSPVSATPTHTLRVCVNSPTTRTILQAQKAQAPTRIRCCAMLGYGEPRGRCLGAIIGKPVR